MTPQTNVRRMPKVTADATRSRAQRAETVARRAHRLRVAQTRSHVSQMHYTYAFPEALK